MRIGRTGCADVCRAWRLNDGAGQADDKVEGVEVEIVRNLVRV